MPASKSSANSPTSSEAILGANDTHVGTGAPACPAERSSAGLPHLSLRSVIKTGAVASRSEATAEWRACPELVESLLLAQSKGHLLLLLGGAALQRCDKGYSKERL